MTMLADMTNVFDSLGIPVYVWKPIMKMESGGNPNSHNTNGEDSRGLFQINISANPKYSHYNLFDPVTNSTIAGRDFMLPAYTQAINSGLTNPEDITAYVWKNGIRPAWTEDKNQAVRTATREVTGGSSPGASSMDFLPNSESLSQAGDSIANSLIYGVFIILGVVILITSIWLIFKPDTEGGINYNG